MANLQRTTTHKPTVVDDDVRRMVKNWDRVLALRQNSLFDRERDVTSRLLIAIRFADWAEKAYATIAYTQPELTLMPLWDRFGGGYSGAGTIMADQWKDLIREAYRDLWLRDAIALELSERQGAGSLNDPEPILRRG